jgi:insertion element IS1 protein InsB
VASRQIVGYTVGQRDERGALKLWQSLPPVYRQGAVCYTDHWKAYRGILPKTRHRIVGKSTGKTNHIERFNNTLRQRISLFRSKNTRFL